MTGTYRISSRRVIFLGFALFFGVLTAILMPKAHALNDGERLIMIHDRGTEKGVITKASTLRDVFDEAGVRLDKNDVVEPGLDEELVTSSYQVNVYRARPVVIEDGNIKQLVMSAHQTPKQIAEHAGIELRDEDTAEVSLASDVITDGASVHLTIDRAAAINLTLYGKNDTVYTQAKTVGAFLKEKNVTLGPNDDTSVPLDSPVIEGMKLSVWRNGKQTMTKEEDIAFETERVQDANREVGYRKVDTTGVKGKKMVTYEVVMKDGREVSRKAIQTVVTKQPEKQIETVGTKPSFSGGFAAALAKLRACESGGNYANKNNPLYRGAYQYSYSTWGNKYGIRDPADATPAQQDQAARETYERRGWQPWPHCGASLPDTFR